MNTETIVIGAGWFPGRVSDLTEQLAILRDAQIEPRSSAIAFLREFSGITVQQRDGNFAITFGVSDNEAYWLASRLDEITALTGQKRLCPAGFGAGGHLLAAEANGFVFIQAEFFYYYVLNSVAELVEFTHEGNSDRWTLHEVPTNIADQLCGHHEGDVAIQVRRYMRAVTYSSDLVQRMFFQLTAVRKKDRGDFVGKRHLLEFRKSAFSCFAWVTRPSIDTVEERGTATWHIGTWFNRYGQPEYEVPPEYFAHASQHSDLDEALRFSLHEFDDR